MSRITTRIGHAFDAWAFAPGHRGRIVRAAVMAVPAVAVFAAVGHPA